MLNHFYDAKTKEYLYSEEVSYSLKGEPLPALDATRLSPPPKKEGFARVFLYDMWGYVKDHRQKKDPQKGLIGGTPFWLPKDTFESEPRYMTEPGDLPKEALKERPKPPLEVFKEIKRSEIKEAYEKERNGPCPSSLGFLIDADEKALQSIQGLMATYEKEVFFRDYQNEIHTLDLDDLKQLLIDIARFEQKLKEKKWAKEKEISEGITLIELQEIYWE